MRLNNLFIYPQHIHFATVKYGLLLDLWFKVEHILNYFQNIPFSQIDIIGISVVGFGILMGWYYTFVYHFRVKPINSENSNQFSEPVSVIICAKNAVLLLEDNLHLWLEQDYPEFEVIVVDDCSGDETAYFLVRESEKEPRLKYVLLDPTVIKNGSKKLALTLGIKKAQYKNILLTDADCLPVGNQWIQEMMNSKTKEKNIVLGISPVDGGKGFLGGLVEYENLFTALNYTGMAMAGLPYMGVGRNLSYTKDIYDSVNGFSSHHHIPAGDDDLFIQSVSNGLNTSVCLSTNSFTTTKGPKNFQHYWRQKMRHLWVGRMYRSGVKFHLMWYPLSQLIFWISLVLFFIIGSHWIYPTALVSLKLITEWIIYFRKGKKLQMRKGANWYPIYNLVTTVWYPYISIRAYFKKRIIW